MVQKQEYIINCWHCGAEFDAFDASFCSHPDATKICPFCLNCFCDAPEKVRTSFIQHSPIELLQEKISFQEGGERKLGDMLVHAGKITRHQLERAIEMQKLSLKQLGEILISEGWVTMSDIHIMLVGQKEIDDIDLSHFVLDFALVEKLGHTLCLRFQFIPLEIMEIDRKRILRCVVRSKESYHHLKGSQLLSPYLLMPYTTDNEKFNQLLQEIRDDDDVLTLR